MNLHRWYFLPHGGPRTQPPINEDRLDSDPPITESYRDAYLPIAGGWLDGPSSGAGRGVGSDFPIVARPGPLGGRVRRSASISGVV
jgi:hypothetical protein